MADKDTGSKFHTAKEIDDAGGKKVHLSPAEEARLSKELDAINASFGVKTDDVMTGKSWNATRKDEALAAQLAEIEAQTAAFASKIPTAIDVVRESLMTRSISEDFGLAARPGNTVNLALIREAAGIDAPASETPSYNEVITREKKGQMSSPKYIDTSPKS